MLNILVFSSFSNVKHLSSVKDGLLALLILTTLHKHWRNAEEKSGNSSNSTNYEIQLQGSSNITTCQTIRSLFESWFQNCDIQKLGTATMPNGRWQCFKIFGFKLLPLKSTQLVDLKHGHSEHSDAHNLNSTHPLKANTVQKL